MAQSSPCYFGVLFLYTGNSRRSQMAEPLLQQFSGEDFEVYSAGTDPKPIHPWTRQVMVEIDQDPSTYHSEDLRAFPG